MSREEELQALFTREGSHVLPNGHTAKEYRDAVGGVGDDSAFGLVYNWKDKPHRLVYDLLRVIDTYKAQIDSLTEQLAIEKEASQRIRCMWCGWVTDPIVDLEERMTSMNKHRETCWPLYKESFSKQGLAYVQYIINARDRAEKKLRQLKERGANLQGLDGLGPYCSDGGVCHHHCEARQCFRQKDNCCVPLSVSGLTDDWKVPVEEEVHG